MASIVIYGSQYGTAKKYAEELARKTGFAVCRYDAIVDINEFDAIAYVGSLYAGGVMGMKKTFSRLASCKDKTIAIATVGLADPADQENVRNIQSGVERQLSKDVFRHARLFCLRGGIDYSKLSFKHKTMMRLLHGKAKNLPEEQKTAEVRAMLETYGERVDFVDFDSLDPIVAYLQAMEPIACEPS
ncbi:MAG: hypothetical protein IKF78_05930 [Atopobiaceae bacterium]|nr:hypothetical protein [Atopobiaceae bacterium]